MKITKTLLRDARERNVCRDIIVHDQERDGTQKKFDDQHLML